MKNGRSYTKMCKDLFCVELKKHFLIKWMVTYKHGKKSQASSERIFHIGPVVPETITDIE